MVFYITHAPLSVSRACPKRVPNLRHILVDLEEGLCCIHSSLLSFLMSMIVRLS